MFYMQEFEIFESEGIYLAFPFGLDGGTEGETFSEAVEMAGDWLRATIQDALIHNRDLPSPTFGNEPQEGGKVVLAGIGTTLNDIPTVSAAEAATALEVSRPRITKMLQTGQLEGWQDGRNTRMTIDSIKIRLEERATAKRES